MKNAIIRPPGYSFVNSINDWYANSREEVIKPINLKKSLKQYNDYLSCLKKIGIKIHALPGDNIFPDGCFTQDPVLVYKQSALKLNAFAKSRRGEADAIVKKLESLGINIEYMAKGYCDGGDVLVMEDLKKVFVGLSKRTNVEGFKRIKKFYKNFNFTVESVAVSKCLHLMTGTSYLGNGNFLISSLVDLETLTKIRKISKKLIYVSDAEVHAVNVIATGRNVIMPKGNPQTKDEIKKLGYTVIESSISEFEKADGGVTCLSLLF